ncbi:Piso0_004172 [Millerozyma farinosa CBS 7064]|uniref:Piso0_004172 protein n=1 Tax=Pichia sorbitophila (strain ATCC MYA-4447 / BCRC 22081 / CBS 7064 / NBRC 10061 / NRRL Y-12695) TaxID=559304 RepID=G8Y7P2_PICSO|nr:Piso0_004172 [Millerozyma farinosa CBS 7064]CCE84622.1 Piso0_004172 [Millerozyma farinosa CBS 7064]
MGDDFARAMEIQRRHFEAQFGSIESMGYKDKAKEHEKKLHEKHGDENVDEEYNISESSFSGFSSENDSSSDGLSSEDEDIDQSEKRRDALPKPKVVKLDDSLSSSRPQISKAEKKLLRSGKALTLEEMKKKEALAQASQANKKEDDDNLENDVKLQRLLEESHILANKMDYSGADLTMQTMDLEVPTGKARLRTLDSRMRSLSSTNSSTGGLPKRLESMPMSMRKGMIKSHEKKVARYEEEAKNAGIVLSKVKKGEFRNINQGKGVTPASDRIGLGKKNRSTTRDKGLTIQSIGKSTRNGLIISQKDLAKINGPKQNKRKRR